MGCGTAISKIRGKAELAALQFEQSNLIRINLDDMENVMVWEETPHDGKIICVRMGALAALSEIDRLMARGPGSDYSTGARGDCVEPEPE